MYVSAYKSTLKVKDWTFNGIQFSYKFMIYHQYKYYAVCFGISFWDLLEIWCSGGREMD